MHKITLSLIILLVFIGISCEQYPPIYVETHTFEGPGMVRKESKSMIVLDSTEFSIGLYKLVTPKRDVIYSTRRDVLRANIEDPLYKEIWYHIVAEDTKDIDFADADEFLVFMDEHGYSKIYEKDSLHHTFYTFKKK